MPIFPLQQILFEHTILKVAYISSNGGHVGTQPARLFVFMIVKTSCPQAFAALN